ncbi:hypothetical protein [Prauserella endophytica]|uniref:Helix-turn-helix domain-containing protein n=1 Tax=Prauserella endophytica TaxID=1592324 RepID=A0ABY2RZX4_9PSEU|nr:hypothetical protein [Prauserella endophytica]PXY20331.1 hypothetical protein BAY59_31325 [Prauserella coralliicola]TKG66933.1 hypothetical protein FCN18_23770 [Prauserella endophytica]
MPGPPLPQETRDAIADAIRRVPTPSHRAIASEFGVSISTVYRVAVEYDLADAWEDRRERTEAATAANAAELARRRTELQAGLLDDIAELRERLFGDVVHLNVVKVDMGREEVEQTVLPAGPAEWRATMGAITGAAAQAIGLARLEAENSGAGQASNMLEQFENSLRQARHEREAATARDAEADG